MTIRARVLIVDDEPIARRGVRRLLEARDNVEVIGECGNGTAAVEFIARERPDLVFLDIQMPGLDGFGVIRAIGAHDMPSVVFVTAFDEYALEAFAVAATDYVMKPFSPERLNEATDRALLRLREQRVVAAHEQLLRTLGELPSASVSAGEPWAARILVSVGARSIVVPLSDVNVFEADGYHVRVWAGAARYTLRETLKELESRVSPDEFIRIHRSAIVRIGAVRGIVRTDTDALILELRDGAKLPVSRARRDGVIRKLGSIRG